MDCNSIDIVISYLPEEEVDAQETIEAIQENGRKVLAIPGDLSDESFPEKLVHQAIKEFEEFVHEYESTFP